MSTDYNLLIVGAGPASLVVALATAPSSARTALVDDNPVAGGQIWCGGPHASLPPRAHQARQHLAGHANVEYFPATWVVACSPSRRLLLENPQRGQQVGYRHLALCAGARELLLPSPGWTLPGVTGAGGLQALAKGGLLLTGQRLMVADSSPLLLASIASASQCGTCLLRVTEQASARTLTAFAIHLPHWPGKLWQAAGLFTRSYHTDSYMLATLGKERLEAVHLREGGRIREITCERLACGFGLVPNVQLGRALGYRLDGQTLAVDEQQAGDLPGHYAVGEYTGFGDSGPVLVEDTTAGHTAVDEHDATRRLQPRRRHWQGFADTLARHFALCAGLRELAETDTLVCHCEDVPLAALAGHAGRTEAKPHSRCGMGACRGRTYGSVAQFLFSQTPPTPCPSFSSACLEALAHWQGDAG